ncbi:MAG: hypothetical protein KAS66_14305 [Candidatus Omnitrophica bacterium]|nr:hypothetical protein [Candidatus Omnitrophota bacterium]
MKKLSPSALIKTLEIINDLDTILRPEVVARKQEEYIDELLNCYVAEEQAKNSKKTSEKYSPIERKGALTVCDDSTSEHAFEMEGCLETGRGGFARDLHKTIEIQTRDLADNIRKDMDLLKEYEDQLRYENDPRRMKQYRMEIERQRESLSCYQQEYKELQREVTGKMPVGMGEITDMLQQIDTKLNTIQGSQKDLLARFDDSEQLIISTIVHRLDQTHSAAVRSILDVIEADRVSKSDLQGTLNAVQEALSEIKKNGSGEYDPQLVREAGVLSEVVDDPKLDVAHKLKLSVPIIPLILSYETELGLKSGLNLKAAWNGLKARVRSR